LTGRELISVAQMRAIDFRSAALGIATRTLMENAGRAVATEVMRRFAPEPVIVLCGPGGNGGDGFVAARVLLEAGWPVHVFLHGDVARLAGDAADAAHCCPAPIHPLDVDAPVETALTIDALFGAGLARPLDPLCADLAARARRVVSIDVPSGLAGDGAPPEGAVFRAVLTVTFVRKKIAHALEPGRSLCGTLVVADIGAPEQAVADADVRVFENHPTLWSLPWPGDQSQKHSRGKVAVWAGASAASLTDGAVRLTARAAQRSGAGWVSVYARPDRAPLYANEPAALVVRSVEAGLAPLDAYQCVVFGPGAGPSRETAATARAIAAQARACVLDADALSAAADDPAALFAAFGRNVALTPHGGEFARLFPSEAGLNCKLDRARAAAARCGAVVLLKGADTIIAAPDGRAIVNRHATPFLATAGAGDVLSGVIAALIAQGMAPLEAAAAAAWIHGEAGLRRGAGLIADDLVDELPAVLDALAPDGLRRRSIEASDQGSRD
jgi:NAD(P)H-hydrate epimerase